MRRNLLLVLAGALMSKFDADKPIAAYVLVPGCECLHLITHIIHDLNSADMLLENVDDCPGQKDELIEGALNTIRRLQGQLKEIAGL
jgi:hypothetical protein